MSQERSSASGAVYRDRASERLGTAAQVAVAARGLVLLLLGVTVLAAQRGGPWVVSSADGPLGLAGPLPGPFGTIVTVQGASLLVTAALWLAWEVCAQENLWAMDTRGIRTSPGGVVLWWSSFVAGALASATGYLTLLVGVVSKAPSLGRTTIMTADDTSVGLAILAAGYLLEAVAAPFAVWIIRSVDTRQHLRRLNPRPLPEAPAAPHRPDVA